MREAQAALGFNPNTANKKAVTIYTVAAFNVNINTLYVLYFFNYSASFKALES